jgi:hypothetical protein
MPPYSFSLTILYYSILSSPLYWKSCYIIIINIVYFHVPVTVAERSKTHSLGRRDRGFEFHSGHGCLVFVYVCAFLCLCTGREALRRADHPSKESYRLSLIKKLRKLSPMLQKREQPPKCGSNEEEEEKNIVTYKGVGVTNNYGF